MTRIQELEPVEWTFVEVALGELTPWDANPKTSTAKDHDKITTSFDELNQFQTVAISPTGDVYDGHQRLSALLAKHGSQFKVKALQSSRHLTEEERKKIAIYSRQIGRWNWDILSNWEPDNLIEWGLDKDLLSQWGEDFGALKTFLESEEDPPEDDNYTRKIEAPTYTPSDEQPEIPKLYDDTKTAKLLQEIEEADGVTDAERAFLRVAAQRHTVINFHEVANYYAHAGAECQRLMENSALVIIDFDRAIELGFVKLTDQIAALARQEYGSDD